MKIIIFGIFFFVSLQTYAKQLCENVQMGLVPDENLQMGSNGYDVYVNALCWNKKVLVKDDHLGVGHFGSKAFSEVYIYSGGADQYAECPNRAYLVDRSYTPPKVIKFGIKNACGEIDYVSSGKKNLVVAFKDNIKFKYEGGKLIPPPVDDYFLQNIKIDANYAKTLSLARPYVEELPPPK